MAIRAALAAAVTALALAILAQGAAGATLVADYRFQDTLSSSVPGPSDPINLGSGNTFATETVGCSPTRVLTFPKHNGLQLNTSAAGPANYSIVVLFRFANVSGYERILNFATGATTGSMYTTGHWIFSKTAGTPKGRPCSPPTATWRVAFTRAQVGPVDLGDGYVNGAAQFEAGVGSEADPAGNQLILFRDDGAEDSAGAVSRIRVYSGVLTLLRFRGPTTPARWPARVAQARPERPRRSTARSRSRAGPTGG